MRNIAFVVLVGLMLVGIRAQTPVPADKWFDSNGVRLRYVESGTGVPVVLVHGYTRFIESNWIDTGVFAKLQVSRFHCS